MQGLLIRLRQSDAGMSAVEASVSGSMSLQCTSLFGLPFRMLDINKIWSNYEKRNYKPALNPEP